MKRGQILGIAIAAVCGFGAFLGVRSIVTKQPRVVTKEVAQNTTQVLVAKTDIGLGHLVSPENFRWQEWPQSAINTNHIQRSARPNAPTDFTGAIARAPMQPGDPIYQRNLVKSGEGGVLASILTPGMRAASVRIKEETGAGKLILPNDHVDVIVTSRKRGRGGGEEHVSETLFRNVRVLAIGQLIQAADGKKLAEGNTATLELTPRQTEEMAAADAKGEISLVLRSIADFKGGDEETQRDLNQIKILRYGAKSRVIGVVD